jgi:uncharacterized tellurite resistance protein B-like protein
MNLNEMTEPERHALGTLVRRMVGADGVTSDDESAGLQQAAEELGADDFWTLVREGAGERDPDEVVEARARAVSRREAQETIYGVLFSIAAAGSIMGGEASLLTRLAEIWGIDPPN